MPDVPASPLAVHLRPEDNVAVAARPLPAGQEVRVNGRTVTLSACIGLGHKLALRPIRQGEPVLKYGQFPTNGPRPASGRIARP
jgi:altronate hydrolase